MASIPVVGSLRNVLFLDALTCAACGALMTFGAGAVGSVTAIPPSLLFWAGASLFPIGVFMAFAGARADRVPVLPWLAIVGNTLWVAASVGILVGGVIAPNVAGTAFVLAQAAAVAVLTALEIKGARAGASRPAPAAA